MVRRNGSWRFPWERTRLYGVSLPLLLLVAVCGCKGNKDLGQVTGTITLNGEPLQDAFVIFAPTQGGTTSYGRTDAEGRYEMMFSDDAKGAWLGENRVEISTADVGATSPDGGAREKVPAIYNQNSTLKVEVESGSNTHDFELKSDEGRVVQPISE